MGLDEELTGAARTEFLYQMAMQTLLAEKMDQRLKAVSYTHLKAAWGYMYFILRQIGDWTENAKAVYGMWDALLAPVNTCLLYTSRCV